MISCGKHIAILFLLTPFFTGAQILSSKGRFSVQFDRGCSPMTVNITELDTFGSVTRQYYYFEGSGITNERTFTYQDPGTYRIVQLVGADGIEKSDTLFVEAFEPIKPSIEIKKCNGLELSITSKDTYYDLVRVYFSDNDSATLKINETATFAYSAQNKETIGIRGIFNNADNICAQFFEEIVPLPSLIAPNIRTAFIKETCKDSYALYLTLSNIDSLTQYQIEIIQQGNSKKIYDGLITKPSFVIPQISFTKADYCINIKAYDPCNDTSVSGGQSCTSLTSLSLTPFESLYSSYTTSGVLINLDPVNVGEFKIYRKLAGEEFKLNSTQPGTFIDPVGSIGRKYYYKIDYMDSCGQIRYSAETNPPYVDATKESSNTYFIRFSSPANSFTEIPTNEYLIGNDFSQTKGDISTSAFSISLNAKDGSSKQLVYATSNYSNNLSLKSNTLTLRYDLIIHVPNAFTPNGDGLNDTLKFYGLPTKNASLNIYNRWGKLIHSSSQNTPEWDGTINGSLASEGTYLYEISFKTPEGVKRTQKGTFALIKK